MTLEAELCLQGHARSTAPWDPMASIFTLVSLQEVTRSLQEATRWASW